MSIETSKNQCFKLFWMFTEIELSDSFAPSFRSFAGSPLDMRSSPSLHDMRRSIEVGKQKFAALALGSGWNEIAYVPS